MTYENIKDAMEYAAKMVIEYKIEASIDVEPDHFSITLCPWKPYKVHCPYNDSENE